MGIRLSNFDHLAVVQSSSYAVEAGAVKFGDSPHSHVALRLPARGARSPLAVDLQLRTFRRDGLVLFIPVIM